MKGRLKIALASIFVSVLLAEALLRLMPSEIEESSGAPLRYFWSENYLIAASNGAIRGKPNSQVREAATCNGDVEFDVRFYTNNLGFIDDLDYKADRRYQRVFAVVGDSYTI